MKRIHSMLSHQRQGAGNNPLYPLILRGRFEERSYSKRGDTDFSERALSRDIRF